MEGLVEGRTNEDWIAGLRALEAQTLGDLRAYLCRVLDNVLAGRPGQSDAEDFAQQAVQRILDSLDGFRGESRFTTWASAVAIRIALSELRKKRWSAVSLDAVLESGARAASVPAMQHQGGTKSALDELLRALREGLERALTERQRRIVLAELNGIPTAILCDEFGMTRGAIYKMHHDARKRLRTWLEAKGFGIDDVRFALDGASNP